MSPEQRVKLFGEDYPVKLFQDRGKEISLPYETVEGVEHPIILSSVVILKQENKYLMVKEADKGLGVRDDEGKYTFPGGGCESNEDLVEAAYREVKEETPFNPSIRNLIGIYKRINKRGKVIFKAAFRGEILGLENRFLDFDIKSTHFFSEDEITSLAKEGKLKTSDIMAIFNDYLKGTKSPLDKIDSPEIIKHLARAQFFF